MDEWISVKDRLPECICRVLCACWDYDIKTWHYELLWFENGHWWNSISTMEIDYSEHVTYWMPLVKLPPLEPLLIAHGDCGATSKEEALKKLGIWSPLPEAPKEI